MNNESPAALLPCPFCGGDAYFERTGTQHRSCIVSCTDCGARHESGDEGDRSGSSWNRRASTAPGASESRGSVPDALRVLDKMDAWSDELDDEGMGIAYGAALHNYRVRSASLRAMLAAPTPPAVSNGEPPDWAIAQAFRERDKIPFYQPNDRARELAAIYKLATELARSAASKEER